MTNWNKPTYIFKFENARVQLRLQPLNPKIKSSKNVLFIGFEPGNITYAQPRINLHTPGSLIGCQAWLLKGEVSSIYREVEGVIG